MRIVCGLMLTTFLVCLLSGCGGSGSSSPPALPTVLAPTVKPVTQQNATSQIASVTATTVVMNSGAPAYKAGDILVSDVGTGILRKVQSSTANANGTATLQTTPAALTDVFQQVELHQDVFLQPSKTKAPYNTVRGVTLHTHYPAHRVDVSLIQQDITLDLPLTSKAPLKLTGDVSVGLKVHFDLVIQNWKLQQFQMLLEGDATADLALVATGDLNLPITSMSQDLTTIPLASVTIPVPTPIGVPIPLIFNFNLVPYVFDNLHFVTTGTLTLAELKAGVSAQGGFAVNSSLSITPIATATLQTPTLTGLLPDLAATNPSNASAMNTLVTALQNTQLKFAVNNDLGLGLRLEGLLYDAAGPHVNLEVLEDTLSAALDLNTSTPGIIFDHYIKCQPIQGAGATLTVFNHNLLDAEVEMSSSPVAFQTHLAPFPITIPLTGTLTSTVN